jgi:threonine dehydratase
MGAFKIRGAMNAVLRLSPDDRERGLITASSGNHGRAVALAAYQLGVPALIVLPNTVRSLKLREIEKLGAKTLLVEPQERLEIARQIAEEEGYSMIHPFDQADVIAGQGTIGLEILDQFPEVKNVFVPMGGGGLISGIASAIKALQPEVKVIGLETAAVPKFSQNMKNVIPVTVSEKPSIADALLSNKPGKLPLELVKKHVDQIISVEEEPLRDGFRLLIEEGRIIAEPSSAIGIGAVLQGTLNDLNLANSVFVISGGNISPQDIWSILK